MTRPTPTSGELLHFDAYVLDPRRRTLSRTGEPVALTPKAFDVLLFLVQNPNRLVTKEELLQGVWGDTCVEEGNLAQYVSHLRKALGDNAEDARLIVTIARKGYQFTPTVTVEPVDSVGRVPIQAVTADESPADAEAFTTQWRTPIAFAIALILVLAGFLSWQELRAVGPITSHKVMLAVLPFQNLTGNPEQEYLADGLTEEMISQLARLDPEQLGVIARTSVMGYKHTDERLDQIGRDLSVQYILESSLRESEGRLRLTAQLIQVKDQTHLWAKDYDYQGEDILNVENGVAKAVAQEVRVRLTSTEDAKPGASRVNPEAFDAYLRGFSFFEKNTAADSERAAQYYERAIQLDSSYALPWVGLSRVRRWQVNIGVLPPAEGNRLARQFVEQALLLNPNLAAAHVQMGKIKEQVDLDWRGAQASFQHAVDLEPENNDAVRMAANFDVCLGRFDEARQLNRRAAALDPLNADNWEFSAELELYAGQLDQAATDGKKALELNADIWPGSIELSQVYLLQGRAQDALSQIARIRYEPYRGFLSAMTYYSLGRQKESDAALSDFISKYPSYTYQIAAVYAFRHQPEQAFEWLDRAFAQRSGGLMGFKVDPLLKNLHGDARYAALLKKLNFPQ